MESNITMTAEYVWIDGQKPTQKLRSKTKILSLYSDSLSGEGILDGLGENILADITESEVLPRWGFDGL